ncbi:BTAD domain-containing putative transcriptional regulator [Nocardioides acrostichi]|uniref:Winged helix-turn-helix domain-containing protein n=1 Tax=Nocardioides acrostichi TaxID=2784339 RepID=A0A930Y6S4_9ACTN|nr:BTAD domain-containing putative transcriptional regulator [Nocardioides acrostichi]MBF4161256.1 winged helix-turn-helix domain-containing protein [Nocardioides acrostichi]
MPDAVTGDVRVRLLGPLRVECAGEDVPLTPTEEVLLRALASVYPEPMSLVGLERRLWPDGPPSSARASLHNHLSRLRRKLGDPTVVRTSHGYRLVGVGLDARELDDALTRADAAVCAGDHARALRLAEQGLRLAPTLDAADLDAFGQGPEQGLLRASQDAAQSLLELRAEALLGSGQHRTAASLLRELTRAQPLREHRWTLLIEALIASGRRADALATWSEARQVVVDQLGLEPGPSLSQAVSRLWDDPESDEPPDHAELRLVRTRARLAALLADSWTLVRAARELLDRDGVAVLTGGEWHGVEVATSAIAASRSSSTVTARCDRTPPAPLQPLVDILRRLDDKGGHTLPPELAWEVAQVLTPTRRPGYGASQLGAVRDPTQRLLRLVGDLAERTGTRLVVVHDVHLAGPTTAAALARLGAEGRVSVLLTVCDADSLARSVRDVAGPDGVLAVPPLTTGELERIGPALIAIPEGREHALARWLMEQTGGLVGQLLALAASVDAQSRSAAPPTLDQIRVLAERSSGVVARRLQEQLESLSPAARRAVEVAVVAGGALAPVVLPGLADDHGRRAASVASFLTADGAPTSRMVVDTVDRDLADAQRTELHLAVAETAERCGAAWAQIAPHRLASYDLDPRAALAAVSEAGDEACQLGTYPEACAWFDDALALLGEEAPPWTVLDLRQRREEASRLAGTPGHEQTLLELAELIQGPAPDPDDPASATVRRRAALSVARLGGTSEVGALDRRAVDLTDQALAAEPDPHERAVLAAATSLLHSMTGDVERCRGLFEAADRLTTDLDAADPVRGRPRRAVLPYAYLSLGRPDDLERRVAHGTELRDAGTSADDPEAEYEGWHLLASCALQSGDGELLRSACERLDLLAGVVGDAGRRWQAEYVRAATHAVDGDLAAAERHAEAALAAASGVAPSRAMAAYGGQLLELRRLDGRLSELVPMLEQAVLDQPTTAAWRAAAAHARAVSGDGHDPGAARAHLDALLAPAEPLTRDFLWLAGWTYAGRAVRILLGEDLADDRLLAHAVRCREALAPWAAVGVWQGTCTYGPAGTVLAALDLVLGDREAAQAHARAAVEWSQRIGSPVYAAEAHALLEDGR